MNSRSQYHAKWRKAQKEALPAALRETRAFMSQDTYLRVVEIAAEQQERLPVAIGRLLDLAVAVIDGKDLKAVSLGAPKKPELKLSVEALLRAILISRFPDDTSASRFRQFAFVQIVADHNARGIQVTATELATLTGAHRPQMDLLTKQLAARGVITRTHVPGYKGSASAKLLSISNNALEQFNKAHIEVTGEPIEGLMPESDAR